MVGGGRSAPLHQLDTLRTVVESSWAGDPVLWTGRINSFSLVDDCQLLTVDIASLVSFVQFDSSVEPVERVGLPPYFHVSRQVLTEL